jgi:hypothetical protein
VTPYGNPRSAYNADQQTLFGPVNTSGTTGTTGGYHYSTTSTDTVIYPQHSNPIGPVDGLDELADMLGVEPNTSVGIRLLGVSGKQYSIIDIIKSQIDLMIRLHVLMVHSYEDQDE